MRVRVVACALFGTGLVFAASTSGVAHEETCDPKEFRLLLGIPVEELQEAELPGRLRVVYPDSDGDLAPDPDRLTLEIDPDGTVSDLHCG